MPGVTHLFTAFPGNQYNVEVMNPVAATPEAGGITVSATNGIKDVPVGCNCPSLLNVST